MLEDVLARVSALEAKGEELAEKGHLLRAAEYFCRAAEAARELGEGSLVPSFMQVQQVTAFSAYVLYAAREQVPNDLAVCGVWTLQQSV